MQDRHVYILSVYIFYDYTGVFRRKAVTDSHMNIAVLPYIEDGSIYMEYAASAAEASQIYMLTEVEIQLMI